MSAADFTIATKDGKPVTMRVFNRSLEKDEQVTTPAGTFDSSLISYNVEITYDGQRSELHGREWYVSGTGVVRSEIYDRNHDLQD